MNIVLKIYLWGALVSIIGCILTDIHSCHSKKKDFVLKVGDLKYYIVFTILSWTGILFIIVFSVSDILKSIDFNKFLNKTILTIKHKQ